ncbi:helix-turn-helix transcriptional regulator [Brevundimonas sp.]|uniref:helix-turn-helix domain-containing protein n=1 Tax=Brevundimonas sp. TaxID=1871086 RepID=UPI0028AD6762|nr:helix-turn-helix transcriptional regulator [Brevundimonas sp.]
MQDWRKIVGSNVRALRIAKGVTQEELAFEADLDLTYVGGIERGMRNPSLMVMARLAEALNVTPIALLSETEPNCG